MRFSYFTTPVTTTKARPTQNISFHELMDGGIKKGFRSLVEPVKKLQYGSEAYTKAKLLLPYFTPHGVFEVRQNSKLIELNGLMLFDFDIKENKEIDVETIFEALCKNRGVYAAFRSPGGGIKFFVRYQKQPDIIEKFTQYYYQVLEWFETYYSFVLDKAQGKLSQPCFVCFDVGAYWNENSTVWGFKKIEEKPNKQQTFKNESTQKHSNRFEFAMAIAEKQGLSYVEGQRHNYICCIASCLNKLGVSQIDTETFCRQTFGFDGTTNAIRWYYQNKTTEHGTWNWKPWDEYKQTSPKQTTPAQKPEPLKLEVPERVIEFENFPIDVFTPRHQAILEGVCKAYGYDQNLAAFAMLMAVSAANGLRVRLELPNGWKQTSSLFGALVADPSVGKTPVLKFAFEPIVQRDRQMNEEYQREFSEWQEECKGLKKTDPKPSEPTEKHLFLSDSTIEALGDILSKNPLGIVAMYDELTAFIRGLTRYQPGSQVAKWLSFWANVSEKITRKNSPTAYLSEPYVTLIGGIQPKVLHLLSDEGNRENGFFYRFLFCFAPNQKPKTWGELCKAEKPAHLKNQWADDLFLLMRDDRFSTIHLSDEANEIWGRFFDDLNARIFAEKLDERKELLGKYSIICSRLMLVLQLMEYASGGKNVTVEKRAAEGAVRLTEYFIGNAFKALDLVDENEQRATDKKKADGRGSGTNWLDVFGSDTELTTSQLRERLIGEYKISAKTVANRLKNELTQIKHGLWTYIR